MIDGEGNWSSQEYELAHMDYDRVNKFTNAIGFKRVKKKLGGYGFKWYNLMNFKVGYWGEGFKVDSHINNRNM